VLKTISGPNRVKEIEQLNMLHRPNEEVRELYRSRDIVTGQK